ncbi:hypothetical protein C5689_17350 [Methylosinus sporium]|uniref:Uncharacterized protein n=1 Tax=Methylosinus sporium TaxID=428 RepID=A0A2U1SLV6_METSR|nr:hypothetical protein C5689_17350 [Methylosinus sporium]
MTEGDFALSFHAVADALSSIRSQVSTHVRGRRRRASRSRRARSGGVAERMKKKLCAARAMAFAKASLRPSRGVDSIESTPS